jgi:hypothetical protein
MEHIREALEDEDKFIKIARQGFMATDTDQSGFIEIKELKVAMKEVSDVLGFPAPDQQTVQEVFEILDTDKNNKLDEIEFRVFLRKMFETLASLDT